MEILIDDTNFYIGKLIETREVILSYLLFQLAMTCLQLIRSQLYIKIEYIKQFSCLLRNHRHQSPLHLNQGHQIEIRRPQLYRLVLTSIKVHINYWVN